MVTTQHKKILIKGLKGDTGDSGTDTTVPQAGIIAYKGDTVPDGYILYSEVPDGVLTHITATYTQTATITDASSLDELRPDLVVKAYYYDDETGTTSDYIVTDYTLSGTLTVGTSTITASYKGKSDTFDVTVESSIDYLYDWDFTQSLTDKVNGTIATLGGSATLVQGTGVVINDNGYLNCGYLLRTLRTVEIDLLTNKVSSGGRFITTGVNSGDKCFAYTDGLWRCYNGGYQPYTLTSDDADVFNGKTLKMVFSTGSNPLKIYANNELIYEGSYYVSDFRQYLILGNTTNAFYNMTITGVRIYANE